MEVKRPRLLVQLQATEGVLLIEGVFGVGRRTLMRQWVDAVSVDERRAMVDCSTIRGVTMSSVLSRVLQQVRLNDGSQHEAETATRPLWTLRPEEVVRGFVLELQVLNCPVDFALAEVDSLGVAQCAELVTELHRTLAETRVILSMSDSRALAESLRRAGVGFDVLSDTDMFFTEAEVSNLVNSHGRRDAEPGAIDALWKSSGGHPSLVGIGRLLLEEGVTPADLDLPALLARWDTPMIAGCADTPIYRLIGMTMAVHQFTSHVAEKLTDDPAVQKLLARMNAFGLGSRSIGLNDGSVTFTWEESWREWIIHASLGSMWRSKLRDLQLHIAQVAKECDDPLLEIYSLLAARCPVEAESSTAANTWELISAIDSSEAMVGSLLALPGAVYKEAPRLGILRLMALMKADPDNSILRRQVGQMSVELCSARLVDPVARLGTLALGIEATSRCGLPQTSASLLIRFSELFAGMGTEALLASGDELASALLVVIDCLERLGRLDTELELLSSLIWLLGADHTTPTERNNVRLRQALAARLRISTFRGLAEARVCDSLIQCFPQYSQGASRRFTRGLTEVWMMLDADEPRRALALVEEMIRVHAELLDEPMVDTTLQFTRALVNPGLIRLESLEGLAKKWRNGDRVTRELLQGVVSRRSLADTTPVLMIRDALADLNAVSERPRMTALRVEARAVQAAVKGDKEYFAALLSKVVADPRVENCVPFPLALTTGPERLQIQEALVGTKDSRVHALVERAFSYPEVWTRASSAPDLSSREAEVLEALARGRTNSEIAEWLGVSVHTVKFHRANIYRKFDVQTKHDLMEAVATAGIAIA